MTMPKWPPGAMGQLWEECTCGAEPIYMPHMLCVRCWPKTPDAAQAEPRLPSERFDKNDEPVD